MHVTTRETSHGSLFYWIKSVAAKGLSLNCGLTKNYCCNVLCDNIVPLAIDMAL